MVVTPEGLWTSVVEGGGRSSKEGEMEPMSAAGCATERKEVLRDGRCGSPFSPTQDATLPDGAASFERVVEGRVCLLRKRRVLGGQIEGRGCR